MNTPPRVITVSIDAAGEVSVLVTGCPGTGCHALTADLEAALGRTVEDQHTFERLQPSTQGQGQQAGQGGAS